MLWGMRDTERRTDYDQRDTIDAIDKLVQDNGGKQIRVNGKIQYIYPTGPEKQ